MLQLGRKIGAVLGATAAAVGPAVVAAAPAASAAVPSSFVTPRYGMTCHTGVAGSTGDYRGYATCYTPAAAKWKVQVSCAWGLNPDTVWIYTTAADGWRTLSPPSACYWGVNDVVVVEGSW